MKKKLYIAICLVLLPSILYLAFYFLNDPHGYFGDTNKDSWVLIDNMLDWKNGDYNALLIGDSRLTSFDETYIQELNKATGYTFKNMSYGGAMQTEMNYLTNWSLDQKPGEVKSVIIVTGWYNLNELLQQNRVKSTEKIIENPLSYAFSINNMQDMVEKLRNSNGDDEEIVDNFEISPEEKIEHFKIEWKSMSKYLKNYKFDEDVFNGLASISNRCQDEGIDLKVVVPPWVDNFWEDLSELGEYDTESYKRELSKVVNIYDMEFKECELSHRYEDFSDYSHFHDRTYEDFSNELIYSTTRYSRLWHNHQLVTE